MEEKGITITPPDGYEVDREKSTETQIFFKEIKNKKHNINSWIDFISSPEYYTMNGYNITSYCFAKERELEYIESNSPGTHFFCADESLAKEIIAEARASMLIKYCYDGKRYGNRYVIIHKSDSNNFQIREVNCGEYLLLSFSTYEEAERFINYNDKLLKDIFCIS